VHNVHILTANAAHGTLLRTVTAALKWNISVTSKWSEAHTKLAIKTGAQPDLVVLDLQALAASRVPVSVAISEVRNSSPSAKVALMASRTPHVDVVDRAWAKSLGADLLVADLSAVRWDYTAGMLHAALVSDADTLDSNQKRIAPYVSAAKRAERHQEAANLMASVESAGIDLPALAVRMARSGGVEIKDRSYRLNGYPECFVASEGAAWIAKALSVPADAAITIARAMQAMGLIYHVAREQTFDDAFYFFRVARTPSAFVLADFVSQAKGLRGIDRRDRTYLNTTYGQCFVGSEAVEWITRGGYSLNEAMTIGQRCVNLSIVSHVLDEHPFQDGKYFYRFNDERG
jgi:Domain found in Dishevelled, Egl-10, and Pleckstrin (DEP)